MWVVLADNDKRASANFHVIMRCPVAMCVRAKFAAGACRVAPGMD